MNQRKETGSIIILLQYIAIGFSTNGRMVGSSAIVGWITSDGESGDAKQYLLGGMSPSDVIPDQGELKILNGSLMIESVSSRLYMSFQLMAELPRENLLYAMGPADFFPSSPEFRLREHQFMTTTTINYITGQQESISFFSKIHVVLISWRFKVKLDLINYSTKKYVVQDCTIPFELI